MIPKVPACLLLWLWGFHTWGFYCAVSMAAATDTDPLIRIDQRVAPLPSEARTVELTLHNLHDDRNLNELIARWTLLEDGVAIEGGEMRVDLEPGESMPLGVRIQPPDDYTDHEYHLHVVFFNREGNRVAERIVWLEPERWRENVLMRLRNLRYDEDWQVYADADHVRADHDTFSFRWTAGENRWFMLVRERNIRLIIDGPFAIQDKGESSNLVQSQLASYHRQLTRSEKNMELRTVQETALEEGERGVSRVNLDLLLSPFGYCDVRFAIPSGGPLRTSATASGVAFLIPDTLTQVGVLGEGFLMDEASELLTTNVFHSLRPIEMLWGKTIHNVQALVLVDDRGYGLGLIAWNGMIRLEPHPEGAFVVVYANPVSIDESEARSYASRLFEREIGSVFRLTPLIPGRYPLLFSHWEEGA